MSAVGEDKEKKKRICHPGYEIIVQRLRRFRSLNMEDGLVINEETMKVSVFKATCSTYRDVLVSEASI